MMPCTNAVPTPDHLTKSPPGNPSSHSIPPSPTLSHPPSHRRPIPTQNPPAASSPLRSYPQTPPPPPKPQPDTIGSSHHTSAYASPTSQHNQQAHDGSEDNPNPSHPTTTLTELDLADLPPGFPYTDWRGAWSFAWEYVRGMQGLVTEWTEGTGRYGPVRHTT